MHYVLLCRSVETTLISSPDGALAWDAGLTITTSQSPSLHRTYNRTSPTGRVKVCGCVFNGKAINSPLQLSGEAFGGLAAHLTKTTLG